MMKRDGFSLLETLIATSVVLVMLGAGGTINRALFVANSQAADLSQASNLAERGFQLLETTQSQLRAQGIGSTALVDFLNMDEGQSLSIIPYALTTGSDTLSWCYAGLAGGCLTQVSSIKLDAGSAAYLMSDFLDSGYEIIAIDRKSGADRGIIDFTTRGNSVDLTNPDYDFYERRIVISLPSVANRVVANATGVFVVTVTIKNKITGFTLERSALLSDYQNL